MAGIGRQDDRGFGLWTDLSGCRPAPSRIRHEDLRDTPQISACYLRLATNDDPTLVGDPEMMNEVLRRSDYVVISMPATPETIGCIDRRRPALMKSTAFLINVSRAEIVEEDALYEPLAQRSIAGAALDVWYRYPRRLGPTATGDAPFS
jgi:hypothetical protein